VPLEIPVPVDFTDPKRHYQVTVDCDLGVLLGLSYLAKIVKFFSVMRERIKFNLNHCRQFQCLYFHFLLEKNVGCKYDHCWRTKNDSFVLITCMLNILDHY
jgi:hypothetical protein